MTGGRPQLKWLAGLLGVAMLALLHGPPAGAQLDEIEEARRRVVRLEAEQEGLAQLLEETWVAQVLAEEELVGIGEALHQAESDLWLARSSVEDLAVLLYIDVTTGKNISLWLADGPERFAAGIGYVEALSVEEEAIWNRYRSVADDLPRQQARRQSQLAQLEEIRSRQESLFSELLLKLDAAQQDLALLQSLEEEPAESTTTTTTTTTTLPPTTTTTTTLPPTTTTTTTTLPPTTTTSPIPSWSPGALPVPAVAVTKGSICSLNGEPESGLSIRVFSSGLARGVWAAITSGFARHGTTSSTTPTSTV